ncbi:MAG: hypothetical protein MR332_02740, partial [Fusicatenibacter sp.]|nr:hypothetical protein [Fusicatenibacter sp.]
SVLMSPEQRYYNLRLMGTGSRRMPAFIIICAAAGSMVTTLNTYTHVNFDDAKEEVYRIANS